jgi:hypothetical protein
LQALRLYANIQLKQTDTTMPPVTPRRVDNSDNGMQRHLGQNLGHALATAVTIDEDCIQSVLVTATSLFVQLDQGPPGLVTTAEIR